MSEQIQAAAPVVESQSQSEQSQGSSSGESVQAAAQDAVAVVTDPNATPAAKIEAKKMLKELKIKYNGKEITEALPFEIPDTQESRDYMTKQLQMSKLGTSKSQELADYNTRVQAFMTELKKNPRKVLEDPSIGIDMKKIAAELIEEEIENAKKSPDQLEREKIQAELKELKAQRETEKQAAQEKERQMAIEYNMQKYDLDITKAFEKTDLPKNAYMARRLADYQYLALKDLNYELPAEDAIELVRQDVMDELNAMFEVMPEEVLEKFVGKKNFDRVRKKNMSKKVAPVPLKSQLKDTATSKVIDKKPEVKKNYKDFFGI